MLDATKAYLANEDSISAWVAECCLTGPDYYATLIELFASWKTWAEGNGERAGQRKGFAKLLDARPELERYEQPVTGRAGWKGLMVKPEPPRWDDPP